MWLLHTTSLKLHEFRSEPPPYAILSHTRDEEEVTFQDIGSPECEKNRGYKKIQQCCAQARADDLEFAWIDTCCINKDSSAELSEAINSMFRWYSAAHVCYVYLVDVDIPSAADHHGPFSTSRWWTRGWTLQER